MERWKKAVMKYLWIVLVSISLLLGACGGYGRMTQGPADTMIGKELKVNPVSEGF